MLNRMCTNNVKVSQPPLFSGFAPACFLVVDRSRGGERSSMELEAGGCPNQTNQRRMVEEGNDSAKGRFIHMGGRVGVTSLW
jgi:hypothetical protein